MVRVENGNGDCGICYFVLKEEENTVGGGEGRDREESQTCGVFKDSEQQLSLLETEVCFTNLDLSLQLAASFPSSGKEGF